MVALVLSSPQVKIDETQLKEQEALRRQLQQEQDMLQAFQEAQDEKLRVQHERENGSPGEGGTQQERAGQRGQPRWMVYREVE
jgi:hypothetical protein